MVILRAVAAVVLLCATLLCWYFTRTKATEAKQKAQTVPDTVELYSFVWHQSAENADACFSFSFGPAEDLEAAGYYFSCAFCMPDGEVVEYTDVPITDEQWGKLEAALRNLSFPPYVPPAPYLMDATNSCMEVCWADNGNRFIYRYNGEYAHELHSFLMTFIGQITE